MPKHCFYKINRGDDEAFGEAFYRCSYLAKTRGKGYGSLGANNYSGSRVKPKPPIEVIIIHKLVAEMGKSLKNLVQQVE